MPVIPARRPDPGPHINKNYAPDHFPPDHDWIWKARLGGPYKCICGLDMPTAADLDKHLYDVEQEIAHDELANS